jgi:pyruvate dehydrogenase E1 component beta subunit
MSRLVSYREAIVEALTLEMENDSNVFIYGIDVADHKRIFGTSKGLVERFGSQRCFSTPLCEDAMTGFGLGAALMGMRPVHVHMRVDFLILAMNQLVNMLASCSYGSAGQLRAPMVIRAVIGRGWGQAWQHSKTMHSWFAHVPGLKVVLPARPSDAKGMLQSAIRDDNPVLILEHRWLYDAEDLVQEGNAPMPLEGAEVLREGKDITVAAVSWMVVEALKAAEVLNKHGVDVEVVDIRSAAPLDGETVARSVSKTGLCVVADYDWIPYGLSAELSLQIMEKCFGKIKKPPHRLGFAHAHCPCARPLENAYYPNAISIIRAVENLLDLSKTDLAGEEFYSYEKKFRGPF